jgi:hypothetical protein
MHSWYKDDSDDEAIRATGADSATTHAEPVPRMEPCDLWITIVSEIVPLVTMPMKDWSLDQFDIRDFWDRIVTPRYPQTSVSNLRKIRVDYPSFEPQPYVEYMMYNLSEWQHVWHMYDYLNSTMCVRFEAGHEGSSAASVESGESGAQSNYTAALGRRFIQPDIGQESWDQRINDPHGEVPLFSTILNGIHERGFMFMPTAQAIG